MNSARPSARSSHPPTWSGCAVIRERAGLILDGLPIGETLTGSTWSPRADAMTLATLFDFPFEDRRKLTYWSDMMTNPPGFGPVKSWDHKREELTSASPSSPAVDERSTPRPSST